jgi:hypothetical protein
VARIRVISLLEAQLSDVVEHFVLALARYHTIRQHNVKTLVERVSAHLVLYEEMKLVAELHHELGSRWDRVWVKKVGNIFTLGHEFVF